MKTPFKIIPSNCYRVSFLYAIPSQSLRTLQLPILSRLLLSLPASQATFHRLPGGRAEFCWRRDINQCQQHQQWIPTWTQTHTKHPQLISPRQTTFETLSENSWGFLFFFRSLKEALKALGFFSLIVSFLLLEGGGVLKSSASATAGAGDKHQCFGRVLNVVFLGTEWSSKIY